MSSSPILSATAYQIPETGIGLTIFIAILVAIVVVSLLLPHFLAARVLAENRTFGRICAAVGIHLVLAVIAVLVAAFLLVWNPLLILVGALVYLLVAGAITAQIYQFGLGRGILYGILVNVFAQVISLAIGYLAPGEAEKWAEAIKKKAIAAQAKATPRSFQTVEEAKHAAVQEYPELGKAGSEFNRAFLAKHQSYKATNPAYLQTPDWPWRLAQEVAAEVKGH